MAGGGSPRRTPLNAVHRSLGARLFEFAGWEMPVQYTGVLEEHRAVRAAGGLFDLSHMGELWLTGPDALMALQAVTTNDAAALAPGQAQYTFLCRDDGGILDDLIVYRCDAGFLADGPAEPGYLLIVNAANITRDAEWIRAHLPAGATLTDRSAATALVALQGPVAERVVAPLAEMRLSELKPFRAAHAALNGARVWLSRTGYTGEDGFEIYSRAEEAEHVWSALYEAGRPKGVLPVGLGARDTLRLEMRYTLYGNDIDETTTPLEAGLGAYVKWVKPAFIGKEALARQQADGVRRRLVGFIMVDRAIPRRHYPILGAGEPIGAVTSGSVSPTLGSEIGMGYVAAGWEEPGTTLHIDVRGKPRAARVHQGPFVLPHNRRQSGT